MAIYDGYDKINTIKNLDVSWEGKTGKEVEDFISRRLKQPIGSNITYENQTLTIYNPEGDAIASGQVTVVPPNYVTDITFSQISVNGTVYTNNVEVNYTDSMKFLAGVNVKTFYESTGKIYNLSSKVDVVFYIDGTTEQLIVPNIIPNADDSLQFIDITPLFQRNLQNVKVKARVTANEKTGESTFAGAITIHKIELSTATTHTATKTAVFDIKGLDSTNNMNLYYYDVPLGTSDLSRIERKFTAVSNNTRVELPLAVGGHQILARISNPEGTFYSNWVQANVVSWDKENPTDMLAIIGGIPEKINNCENAKLFQIISVPGLGGSVDIVSYLADDASIFSDDQSKWPEFNRTTLTATSNDEPQVKDYYSYIELTNLTNAVKVVAFSLIINDVSYNLYSLTEVNGRLSGKKTFIINIEENPYNVNNCFNFVPGAIEDFSQVKGQATTLFNDVNSNIEASDGWISDSNLIAYKISGQNQNLFNTPKNFNSLLYGGKGFTIEVMLKNYNVNGDDPVMNIGNLLFGPGYTRVQSSNEEIFTNSRADFEKDEITHLLFVYDPAYKPSTYNNIYDQLFNENGQTYSNFQYTYPILKVFVNGSINREIELKTSDLAIDGNFDMQINPISSDLNLYIFRTYNWAFNYQEIQKNYISSKQTSAEKKEIYDRNDILGSDGRVSFYKTMKNNNVIVVVIPETDKPLYFGNRKTNGDGVDPSGQTDAEGKPLPSKATLLVHYKDEAYKDFNGRFTDGKYKAQGSSAKKYMIHNVQYSKGKFISESDLEAGLTETSSKYAMPTDTEQIEAKKFVGKVNYASSMQSHKLGSVKLFDKAYKHKVFPSTYESKLYSGGKKACLEEAFVYFYYNLKPGQDINTITINDLYKVETINGIEVPSDSDVKFFGFQTWGSGKADDPTFGYGDNTPEYLLVEGADNGSTGANFKQPWAAFQTWTPTVNYDTQKENDEYIIQQTKEITDPTSETYDPTAGLVIVGETIKFDANGTDPWDIDYGLTELDKAKDLWQFTDAVKAPGSSLHHWVNFYNNCYMYDFTNLIPNPNPDQYEFELFNKYGVDDHRVYITRGGTQIYDKDSDGNRITVDVANMFDVYRWDSRINKWVPAGLHYEGSNWQKFNLKTVFGELSKTDLYAKYKDNKSVMNVDFWMNQSVEDETDFKNYILPAFRDMFKANIEEYCDKEDIIYHQAFIRLVSGTDNRAKNTYFQIIGKLYEQNAESGEWIKTDTGDYKIRLMQDDMDTIFATDNNGQQVKPYYLLEPAFNKNTEKMWGDHHSSFFYPFDICYYKEINNTVGQIIDYLVGNATTVKDKTTLLYDYFFKTQLEFPEILYNHHAEIYYEMPQTLFKEGKIHAFSNTLSGFANNSVQHPLSLSHGRCIESEYQFMKDRLLLLGTQSNSAHGLYGTEWQLSTEGSGGNEGGTQLQGIAEYTDYIYPTLQFKRSNGEEYSKLVNLTSRDDVTDPYDEVFTYILDYPGIPTTLSQLVTPAKAYPIAASVDTTITSYMSSAQKIKTLTITQGLDVMHYLPTLPNVKYLNINGATSNYSVNSINIAVKDYLPIVETLIITNATFANSILDLRGCNRLETLNLSGCSGISDIIFPENNRLKEVYLPNDIKKLTLGKNPNLATFVFAEGTYLTDISLDCSSFHSNFDYMDILVNRIDYSNLNQFILKNTPANGLDITESVATKLAAIKNNKNVISSIHGTYVIKDREEIVDENDIIIYNWGNKTNISYNTKKYLVQAFGNIDSAANAVHFKYLTSTLIRNSYKLPALISLDAPNGGTFKPFDSLYFTEGNNVGITSQGLLNINYKVLNLPKGCSINAQTGELTVSANTDTKYTYEIVVTLSTGETLSKITGQIYLGYIEPAIGDYAYSDGTFSAIYDADKTLVGVVFQKEVIQAGQEWKLGILSNKTITDYAGPDYYHWDVNSQSFSNSDPNREQTNIYTFLTNPNGLGITMNKPEVDGYLGFGSEHTAQSDTTVVDYNYLTDNPVTLCSSGLEDTERLVNASLSRLKAIANKSSSFKNYLQSKEILNSQGEFTDKLSKELIDEVYTKFDECVRTDLSFATSANYYKVLHPLALRAITYTPDNLVGSGINLYKKGTWYIPSKDEIELLVWHRIRSTSTTTTANTAANWDSEDYSVGNSIFSDKSTYFDSVLSGTLLASTVSINNKNFIYGELGHYATGAYVTTYGWFYSYIPNQGSWSSTVHLNCRRDMKYSIPLCCTVNVTKSN